MLENLCCESWCSFCRCFRWTLTESTCLTTTDHATSRHTYATHYFQPIFGLVSSVFSRCTANRCVVSEVACLPWPVLGVGLPSMSLSLPQLKVGVRIVELCGQPRTGAKSAATFTSQLTTLRKCHARAEETHRWSSVD